MAMTTPIVSKVDAFDATQENVFSFTLVGGNQVVKNEIKIINNDNNEIVYQNTIDSYVFNQSVPANTLTNGQQYIVSFRTYDVNDNVSQWGTYVLFYCFSKPIISLNVKQNQIIENGSFEFILSYSQSENELINYGYFELYDSSNTLFEKSGYIYNSNTPPLTISHTFNGLEDGKSYKVLGTIITVNDTVVQTELTNFSIKYEKPTIYSTLSVEGKCDDGYIDISTNIIAIDGETNENPVRYVYDNTMVDAINYLDYIKWTKGYEIEKDFIMELWYEVANIGKQIVLKGESSDSKFEFNWIREIPYGETIVKDYVECIGYIDNIKTFYIKSNYVDITNNTTDIILWFKFNSTNDEYELVLDVDNQVPTTFYWNDLTESNIQYGRLTTSQYNSELYSQGQEKVNEYGDMTSIFPITKVELYNGVYDNIDITKNISKEFSKDKPVWDYNTILNCDFNGDILGGNFDLVLSQVSSVKIKRKPSDSPNNWVTLYKKNVQSPEDLLFSVKDYGVPNNIEHSYAIVPVLQGDMEGNYITKNVVPIWNGVFITNTIKTFKLYNGVVYNSTTRNKDIGILVPIGRKYPIIIQNGEEDYNSGSIQGNLFGYNFESTNRIDRNDVVKETNDFLDFLVDGTAKYLVDWNGNSILFRVSEAPSVSYNSAYGNGVVDISFNWIEQGKYNNEEDLIENNLI